MFFQCIVKGLVLALLCGITATAYAHKVNVFAYVEGDQIYVQGYFSDGTKAKNSQVTVYGSKDQELVKGLTDEEGAFTFPSQSTQPLQIVLNAGQGHQATYVIPIDEIAGTPETTSPATPAIPNTSSLQEPSIAKVDDGPTQISEVMVRRAVAQGVRKRPVTAPILY